MSSAGFAVGAVGRLVIRSLPGLAVEERINYLFPMIQKMIGVTCLVVGVLLIGWGHDLAQSVGGQLNKIFTGSPGDKPQWLYIGGAVLCALGLFQIFTAKK